MTVIRVRLLKDVNSLFYYYYFNSALSPIKSIVSQCAQAGIRGSDLQELKVIFPPKDKQDKIANTLEQYDNLIENNQKQIKLLEEAAQRLYKEWFVDLRFPGHENVKIVDGIPEEWEIQKISSFGSVITGKTPSTSKKHFYGGNIPFITIPNMHDTIYPVFSSTYLSKDGADSQKNKYIQPNSIMVSCIATVGLVNISCELCQTNQQINSVIPFNEYNLFYLYFALKDLKKLLSGVGSNGATMTNVNKTKFSNLFIVKPHSELIKSFYVFCEPIFNKIKNLTVANKKLEQARDRLLPKLMSGEIEV